MTNQLILLLAAAFMVICGLYAGHEGLMLRKINRMLAKVVNHLGELESADAERYQWLKKHASDTVLFVTWRVKGVPNLQPQSFKDRGEYVDASVDAARKGRP